MVWPIANLRRNSLLSQGNLTLLIALCMREVSTNLVRLVLDVGASVWQVSVQSHEFICY